MGRDKSRGESSKGLERFMGDRGGEEQLGVVGELLDSGRDGRLEIDGCRRNQVETRTMEARRRCRWEEKGQEGEQGGEESVCRPR